ncbi:MAG: DUF4386 family protein [Nitratireductor sp.]|nr:DUF4386 family protein [Nitratireductor sp.]
MTFQRMGGIAGLVCAATYIFGFIVLVTTLAPLGFGTNTIDAGAVVDLIRTQPGVLILFNTVIYIVNALALAVLVTALHVRLKPGAPSAARLTLVLGTIWCTLVLGAGMIANVATERAAQLAATDFDQAVAFWRMLHEVEHGLGGGNEIAGGAWIASVSVLGMVGRNLAKITGALGALTGVAGLVTLVAALGETAGAVFGLGAIAWFIAVGIELIVSRGDNR